MLGRNSICTAALSVALGVAVLAMPARAEWKYPDWSGQWTGLNVGQWDPTKPAGRGQQAPLTPEFQALFAAAEADRQAGGRGNTPSMTCIPPGMPRAMIVYEGMEIAITPSMTYIAIEVLNQLRRIHTDGRDFPPDMDPSYAGYSVGKWVDEDGEGRYDALVERSARLRFDRHPAAPGQSDGGQGEDLFR